jgi:hypothetical protein
MQVSVFREVEQASLAATEEVLRFGGYVPEPQVHMVIDEWDPPYVGYVRTRPYHQGADAAAAIARLGDAPAAIRASQVVLVWEASDLQTSLLGPGDYPTGLVVVEAKLRNRHVLRWHPFTMRIDEVRPSGLPTVTPIWGPASTVPDARLPPVMAGVLRTWRLQGCEGNPSAVFADLVNDGFPVNLVER